MMEKEKEAKNNISQHSAEGKNLKQGSVASENKRDENKKKTGEPKQRKETKKQFPESEQQRKKLESAPSILNKGIRGTAPSERREGVEEEDVEGKEEVQYVIKSIPPGKVFYATGRRKSSSARVFMQAGSGQIRVNKRIFEDYFKRKTARTLMLQPLEYIKARDKFDFKITVSGGGNTGQAGAIRHGMARALLSYDEEMRRTLRKGNFLTRDPRSVERKKVGLRKARKKPQYSKR